MSRDEILGRVRQAAAAGRRYRVHVDSVPATAGYVGVTGDPSETLAAEVRNLGGQAQIADRWEQARELVAHWLQHYQVRSALCWQHATLERLGLADLLAAQSATGYRYAELAALPLQEQRQAVLRADIGITGVDYAVAETGTLAVCSRDGQERMASLVPAVHLAIVESTSILPDLFDLFAQLDDRKKSGLPSNVALISGPSKTGDIELELTTGVHGPGHWHVVIVRV